MTVPISQTVVDRYAKAPPFPRLSYATVRDYCDSIDHFPQLASYQQDLKDSERPWTVKAILNRVPKGGRLLEVGSGEPLAAATLASLGYEVTICDPFDGSGRGPTEYEYYKKQYPEVRYIRSLFTPAVARDYPKYFDCVYSISVLEHVEGTHLDDVYNATSISLKAGGYSIHVADHVLEGNRQEWHAAQMLAILKHQARLAGETADEQQLALELERLFHEAKYDLETYYLSAQGHNLWRGGQAYESFPFRKCIALQMIARKA